MNVIDWLLKEIPNSKITSPYGMRFHPTLKVNKLHTGTDLGGMAQYTPAPAVVDGVIIGAGYNSAWGHWVALVDEPRITVFFYAHLHDFPVRTGQKVRQRDMVGRIGSTGYSTGVHLHFEIRQSNGSGAWGGWRSHPAINPLQFF